jgi:hypothetical protein
VVRGCAPRAVRCAAHGRRGWSRAAGCSGAALGGGWGPELRSAGSRRHRPRGPEELPHHVRPARPLDRSGGARTTGAPCVGPHDRSGAARTTAAPSRRTARPLHRSGPHLRLGRHSVGPPYRLTAPGRMPGRGTRRRTAVSPRAARRPGAPGGSSRAEPWGTAEPPSSHAGPEAHRVGPTSRRGAGDCATGPPPPGGRATTAGGSPGRRPDVLPTARPHFVRTTRCRRNAALRKGFPL